MSLNQKLSSKGLILIFISILLEKKLHISYKKLYNQSTPWLVKVSYTLSSKSFSTTIFLLQSYLDTKKPIKVFVKVKQLT